jgi:hypothetical protein
MKKALLIPALFFALFLSALNLNAQAAGTEGPSFQDFLSQFPKAELPYSFSSESLKGQLEKPATARAKRLAWDFYQFLPELERSAQYSNMPVYPEPVAAFETNEYYAVLYNIARGASKNTKTYSITVFDKQGNYIGTNFVAGFNPRTITTTEISAGLIANVTEYTVNWKNDYRQNGLEGNAVESLTRNATQEVNLTTPGNPDMVEWTTTEEKLDNVSDVASTRE